MDRIITDKSLLLLLLYACASFRLNAFFMLFIIEKGIIECCRTNAWLSQVENTIWENGYWLHALQKSAG